MSTSAEIGLGAVLSVGGVALAEVISINPSITFAEDDVTDMDSPEFWTEHIKTMGTCDLNVEMHFRPSTAGSIMGLLNDDTAGGLAMSIVWGDTGATTWSFKGLVQDADITGPAVNKMTQTMRIRVTGSMTFS